MQVHRILGLYTALAVLAKTWLAFEPRAADCEGPKNVEQSALNRRVIVCGFDLLNFGFRIGDFRQLVKSVVRIGCLGAIFFGL